MSERFESAISDSRALIRPLLREFPAINIAVGVDTGLVWYEGFGYANLEQKTPVDSRSTFRIYSVSKPITSAALLILRDSLASLPDTSVVELLPYLNESYEQITPRHLAGHLSGIRHYNRGEWLKVSSTPCSSVEEAVSAFADNPLEREPGSEYRYSSYGYVLLSGVIEEISRTPFYESVENHIFLKAGMGNTGIETDRDINDNTVSFYEHAGLGRIKKARTIYNNCKHGAGAFVSTPEDLVKFGLALLNGRLINTDDLDVMFTIMESAGGERTGYGFGWGIHEDEQGRTYAIHNGSGIGGRSTLLLYPEHKIVVAILANIDGNPFSNDAFEIAAEFLAEK